MNSSFIWRRNIEVSARIKCSRSKTFDMESIGVFAESQWVKIFLSKIDKCLIDLELPMIIIDYGDLKTLAQAFAIVEQCDRALRQYNATDLVSLLVDSNKSRKILIAPAELAKAEVDKTLNCWPCRQAGHAKKDCPSKQKQA